MSSGSSLTRSEQWWNHKVPPIVAVAALTISHTRSAGGVGDLLDLALFLLATAGIAAFGHVVNDISDIEADARANKVNRLSDVTTGRRMGLLVAALASGLVPWVWLPRSTWTVVLLVIEVALLMAYSVPPIRLKDRSSAGVLADALYAYVVPALLTLSVFSTLPGGVGQPSRWIVILVATWGLLLGLRGILDHQRRDLANDRRSGVNTFVARIGPATGGQIAGTLVLVEVVVATLTIIALGWVPGLIWVPVFTACYVVYRSFQITLMWQDPVHLSDLRTAEGRVQICGFVFMNEFVERWLPLAALIALAASRPLLWIAVVVFIASFDNALIQFLRHDIMFVPDALRQVADVVVIKRQIRLVQRRRDRSLRRTSATAHPAMSGERRWVFVVCGPRSHLDTLRTSIQNLRPLTSLEIWVITDSRRNEVPLDTSGIDRIVDVEAPPDMDDHQASIWLKTGAHRHLPLGQWCYLDSDIIAVRGGLEEIFEYRRGPVVFASDLPIANNQVDRFSPWAMNCGCSGHGDDHSCDHLTEQLLERFGLTVPNDWVHWNGGVFLFGPDSHEFLDLWHRTAIESFSWPQWRTRDQGALIATAWMLGQEDCPKLPHEFNFIADLGNYDLCLNARRGWALQSNGPWCKARFLHLHTSKLEDPDWQLGRDLEQPIIRQTVLRTSRWHIPNAYWYVEDALAPTNAAFRRVFWRTMSRVTSTSIELYWRIRFRYERLAYVLKHTSRRLHPDRVRKAIGRRRNGGSDVGESPVNELRDEYPAQSKL